tara:strand:- start:2869 stop:4626 length:1758 start_codon:yes stop_codon:yes gene_type:complete
MADSELELGIKVTGKGIDKATDELNELAKAGEKAETGTKNLGKAAKSTVAPMKNLRSQAQQASYQFQDIAVQAQMGTSWFTIIGQQGSQLASVFGPAGAITGALIAFGAIIGGVLVSSMADLSSEIDKMDKSADNLAGTYHKLTEAQKAYLQISIAEEMLKDEKSISGASARIKEIYSVLEAGAYWMAPETIQKFNKELLLLGAASSEASKSLDTYKDILAGVTPETKKAEKKEKDYIESLQHKLELLTLTGDELFKYKAKTGGATKATEESAVAILREIDAIKEREKQLKITAAEKKKADAAKVRAADKAKAEKDRAAERLVKDKENAQGRLLQIAQSAMEEAALIDSLEAEAVAKTQADRDAKLISQEQFEIAKTQLEEKYSKDRVDLATAEAEAKKDIQMQVLNQMSGIAGQLSAIAEEGSREAKVLFAMQKAIAIAQIIVATETAALTASAYMAGAGPVAWLTSVQGIRALGYASAGIVAGTAIAGGRALGGQVRGGESYLVGERGPELLTMGSSGRIATNENLKKAVGSESGQSQANVSVNFSIQANDTAGFDRLLNSRRGQIVSMINHAVNNRGRASIT